MKNPPTSSKTLKNTAAMAAIVFDAERLFATNSTAQLTAIMRAIQLGVGEVGAHQVGEGEVDLDQRGAAEDGTRQVRSPDGGAVQHRAAEVGASGECPGQVTVTHAGSGEGCPGEDRGTQQGTGATPQY